MSKNQNDQIISKKIKGVRDILAFAEAQLTEVLRALEDTTVLYSEILSRREEIEDKLFNSVNLLTELIKRKK